MRISSLTLLGFKSFADKAQFDFAPGINAIVGPNGAGKSNIVDALRWVTGGGRAGAYRAEEKGDLIFHGSEARRGVNFAEVALAIDGPERLRLSRSLYRDGQVKLTLNGKAARLSDVDEALAGSGLGRSSLAVIGQGEVGQVLVADPARLLAYVEEAAGISRLSGRREQALGRLTAANEHLLRLDDLLQELRGQLARLSQEAAQAERVKALNARSLLLRYTLAYRRAEALETEVQGLRRQRDELKDALEGDAQALEEAQNCWQRARARLREEEATYRQALAEGEARRGDLRVAEERLKGLQARRLSLERERAQLERERASLESVTRPERPDHEIDDLRAGLTEAAEGLRCEQEHIEALEGRLGQEEAALAVLKREAADHAQALGVYRARRGELENEVSKAAARLAELERSGGGLEVSGLEEATSRQAAGVEVLRRELEGLRQDLAALQGEHASAHARAQTLSQAASRARAAYTARRGYSEGPRQALTSGIAGIVGAVADLISVPRDYGLAVSSALGRRAEHIVVDSAETAQRVLDALKRRGGRATLLPLDLIEDRSISYSPALAAERGFIGALPQLIDFEPRYGAVVRQLLGNVALVETLEDGIAIARRHRRRPRLVTSGGDLIEAYGALTGGKAESSGAQLIGLFGEVEAAERERDEAAAAAGRLRQRVGKAQERFRVKAAKLEEARGKLQVSERALAEAREARAARASLLAELTAHHERTVAQLTALRAPEAWEADDGALEGEVARLKAELEHVQEALVEANRGHARAREQLSVYEERWRGYEEAERRFEAGQARLADLCQRQEGLEAESWSLGESLRSAERELKAAQASLPSDLEEKRRSYEGIGLASQEAEAQLAELSQVQAARNAEHEALTLSLVRREASLELAHEERAAFPEGLGVLEGSLKALRGELAEAEEALRSIGPVNYRAAQEKEAQEARLEELTAQTEEARAAANELGGMLRRLDEEVTVRLETAIVGVRGKFSLYCRQLFGGGEADISALREEGRPSGLKITLQPPGKRTRSLNLLSVGERTMGALAFLFALIAKSGENGLSIAVLDEVDAPLDEANIRRFCSFLKSLANTQFVLVTHQKATLEVADALWGVTTERGVSRVFSISKAHELV